MGGTVNDEEPRFGPPANPNPYLVTLWLAGGVALVTGLYFVSADDLAYEDRYAIYGAVLFAVGLAAIIAVLAVHALQWKPRDEHDAEETGNPPS